MADYAIREDVNRPYEETVAAARAALASEGFGVLTEIDVKATMKEKLDKDFPNYVILGACSPPNAFKVLSAEPDAGLFLPCNVVVYEKESGGSVVAAVNAESMMRFIENDEIMPVAAEITGRLRRVVEAVKGTE